MKAGELTKTDREEIAIALLLWRDFKGSGAFDDDVVLQMLKLAEILGVSEELGYMMAKVPPMIIKPKYGD